MKNTKESWLYDEGASAYYDWHDWYIIQAILHDYVSLYKSGNIISPRALIDEILSIADSIINFIPRDMFEKIKKEREGII